MLSNTFDHQFCCPWQSGNKKVKVKQLHVGNMEAQHKQWWKSNKTQDESELGPVA